MAGIGRRRAIELWGSDMGDEKLGAKFWLAIVGGAFACAIAGVIVFLVISTAWARWGFFATFLLLAAILLGFGWWYDRREKQRYEGAP